MKHIHPENLDDFVGQTRTQKILEILCRSAKSNCSAIDPILLCGSPGLGKTTLARIVARTLGGRLIETIGGSLQTPDQLISILRSLKPMDTVFIDEIHATPRAVEECLYPAIADSEISVTKTEDTVFMKSLGMPSTTSSETITLPPFTLIGATTLSGLVSAPLRSRFAHEVVLEPYGLDDLSRIVHRASIAMGRELKLDIALEVAQRSRQTARIAIGNLRWLLEYCSGTGEQPDSKAVKDAFELKGIDENGLTERDRNYLHMLTSNDQPVGLATAATALNESVETIEQAVEPYLITIGLVQRTPRGRVATNKARQMFQSDPCGVVK